MKPPVRVQFWGTRGSIARPGREMLRYGGNTSCVQVTSPGGTQVIIDCGTGVHDLGQQMLTSSKGGPMRGHILISHTHWDHIQGFPFFAPLFVRGGHWDIYGPSGLGQSLRETLAGQMQYSYFPVTLDELGASIRFHDLAEGTLEIDDIRIRTRYLNHPALTLGYRLEMGDVSVVYACDHEPYSHVPGANPVLHEDDRLHAEFLAGADLVIHDAQFTAAEYPAKKGWGHSPVEFVAEIGRTAGVKRLAFTHHDPRRTDEAIDEIVESVRADLKQRGSEMEVFGAADGQVVELQSSDIKHGRNGGSSKSADAPAIKDSLVILGVADAGLAVTLAEAASAEGVRVVHVCDGASTLKLARSSSPSLILVEDELPDIEGTNVCRSLRMDGDRRLSDVPIVIVGKQEESREGMTAGATGWLTKPFSTQYARAQIQAWLMRSACRWMRAPLPPDEDTRLAALHSLAILDTPPEERFDRITRIAAALADVPYVTVSLIDSERQWFKSCIGLDARETSRELAFCAHVVVNRKPVIVPDTLLDDRFADSPVVTGAPRIRFYAGFPVFHRDGGCLGTLCLIDTRPRQFSETAIQRFTDLASVVEEELNAGT